MIRSRKKSKQTGFTIVELLIVIVVIAILAAISIVAYTGIQERARDSQRLQDVKTIAKALEMYYLDNGSYPPSVCGASCPSPKKINSSWATTSDGSWSVLEAALVPKYISSLPKDPSWSTSTNAAIYGGYNYDYGANFDMDWCGGVNSNKFFILSYRLESAPRQTVAAGDCPEGSPRPSYAPASWHLVNNS